MPVFNRADIVARAIGSVLNQHFPNFELIVVDDGSTDGSADAVCAIDDPRVELIALGRNMGGNAARNVGIRAARAPLITFLDSDDEYLPDRLGDAIAYFARQPGIDLLIDACIKRWPGKRGMRHRIRHNPNLVGNDAVLAALFDRRLFKATPGITVRREAAVRAGLFDEGLRRRQDYDFLLRVAKVGALASRDKPSWVKTTSADAITADLSCALSAITALWDRHPEHFATLSARTGMADDLARHFTRLAVQGEAPRLLHDGRIVVARFGVLPVAAMLMKGFGSYLTRKAGRVRKRPAPGLAGNRRAH